MLLKTAILLAFVHFSIQDMHREPKQQPELSKLVRNWAEKLGGELWHFGELVTRQKMVTESYKHTTVIREDGEAILKDINEKVSHMMSEKVKAVSRIMEVAENTAVMQGDYVEPSFDFYNAKNLSNSAPNYTLDEPPDHELNDDNFPEAEEIRGGYESAYLSPDKYRSMIQTEDDRDGYQQDQEDEDEDEDDSQDEDLSLGPEIEVTDGTEKDPQASQTHPEDKRRLPLYRNAHFYNIPVNTNYSAVHVPSNVYERSKEVIKGIKWSEELDKTFRNNYREDPTLSWQYFGSSTGFMRQFPAMIWSQEPIDLFDCRTRSWYIEAASSPKDVIILVDRSGSMTGMRREIARHVVYNILDTLGNNDYVNIFTFSNTTDPLVECFDEMLVQANLANIRLLKDSMTNFRTEQIANFSLALTTAFELLQTYRMAKKGARCNQAIMLITDGVQYNYIEIFKKYNWEKLPFMHVRVFTYLIGREVSDVRDVKWMACANQGYYVHLSTYAEVREEVLQYIPVMARPMVLNPTHKPNPTWSPVYADVTDPKLTNWLWVTRQRNKQRDVFLQYLRNKTLFVPDEQDRKYVHQQKINQDNYGEVQRYHLMTSVSLPVYDRRENANITENIQVNEAVWITVTRETRVANLLGVAGTDVPVEYIQKLMLPYRLGVNGYAFIVTNNGYILIHPDLRPVFQGILKPAYNRVDMIEIEITDDENEPREFSEEVKEFRRKVVMQEKGNVTFKVKTHLDDMRRIILSTRHYFFMGLNNTPFSLVVALPHKYGFNRIQHPVEDDIHRIRSNDKIKGSLAHFFTGNWTIHPDWHYCKYLDDKHVFESPEEELLHFLGKMDAPGWKWTKECDRKLVCKVVADAKITSWFSQNISETSKEENGHEFIKRFGITVAFMATHSGLTRWQDFPQNIDKEREVRNEPHFHLLYNRAIDEIWYKRAVEQHYIEPRSFVYSVPFDIGDENYTLVTATHAIFKEDGGRKAPAAVVGFQFYQSALHSLFTKITTNCGDIPCRRKCDSEELYCLVLDDNGYVVVSDKKTDTGRFFGEIRSDIMALLVDEGIYKPNRMYDYQATCFAPTDTGSPASKLLGPLTHLIRLLEWFLITLAHFLHPAEPTYTDNTENLTPCDHVVHVYTLTGNVNCTCNHRVFYVPVPSTNLIFVAIADTSPAESENVFNASPEEIEYVLGWTCTTTRFEVAGNNYATCHNAIVANPLVHFTELLQWFTASMIYFAKSAWAEEVPNIFQNELEEDEEEDQITADQPLSRSIEKEFDQRLLIKKTNPEPCDQEMWLYTLTHYTDRNISRSGYNKTMTDNCTRPFLVQPVVGSNMILIVINNICLKEKVAIRTPDPFEIDYNMTLACYRVSVEDLPRRYYMSCINRHINESKIKLCGSATDISASKLLLASLVLLSSSLLLFGN